MLLVLGVVVLAATSPAVSVRPGGVVRWSGASTTSCSGAGRVWAPVGDTCYFPVDLEATGELRVERTRAGRVETATLRVGAYPYPTERLKVAEGKVHLSPEDEARAAEEAERITALWARETPPRPILPLASPLAHPPGRHNFGSRRVFNGEPRSPHSGVDYRVHTGTPVQAAAAGTVVLTGDLFFSGGSVFLDHGGGLITMYFHLSRVDVREGETVRRGQRLGLSGATGRATGPHLHFGVRWHGARVDPGLALGPVEGIPALHR